MKAPKITEGALVMRTFRMKLLAILVITLSATAITGCYNVQITSVPEPSKPVISNLAKYEAPERSIAPEPQESTGIG
jgi:hypothetical protein